MQNQLILSEPADSGNIKVLDASDPTNIRLEIRPDGKADFFQWFYFRAIGEAGTDRRFVIENAAKASYTGGWSNYKVCASYDLDHWFRIDTEYADGKLVFEHQAQAPAVYYAYFAPYPLERYRAFAAEVSLSPLVEHTSPGLSLDGEPLDLFSIGTEREDAPQLWVIARQHPGETMGSWWMEGFVPRLLDEGDAAATALRQRARIHVVPLVNLDGSRRGHLRTNAAGTDLNREWAEPSTEKSPEVFHIRRMMDEIGCDFFLDVHGDEAIANNFIAGAEGIPKWSDTHQQRLDRFKETLKRVSPAFQTEQGYPVDKPGKANLKIAANGVGERFDCLSMTLEMPFKDAAILPEPAVGWSPERCADLGRSCLDAIWQTLPLLKD